MLPGADMRHHGCFSKGSTAHLRAGLEAPTDRLDRKPPFSFSPGATVKLFHTVPVVLLSAALLAGCDTEAKKQLAVIAHVDTLRVDSLAKVRQDLVNEVMASTQFVTEINTEQTASTEQRRAIISKISRLVARLDSVQNRLASARSRIAQLSREDSALV